MEEMIQKMVAQVGIDRATAEKIVQFLQQHAADVPKWLGQAGVLDKLPGGLGDLIK